MKTIGILGGASWTSTISPYRWLNEEVNRRLGGSHSARIVLYSMDYDPIKSQYQHGWKEIPNLFKREVEYIISMNPDCLIIANNTLHKAYDMIEDKINISVPLFHAVRLTCDELKNSGVRKILFLGTKQTMKDDYFTGPLRKCGISVMLPDDAQMDKIQSAQEKLAKGKVDNPTREFFSDLLEQYEAKGCKTVVLACTELPLVVNGNMTRMAIIDPLILQCKAAVDYALDN